MRHACLMFVLLFVACDIENGHVAPPSPARPCNLRVTAPLQLDRATIAVDGTLTSSLIAHDPMAELVRSVFGARKRPATAGFCYVPAGTHTIRIEKPGFEPMERVVTVSDPKTCLTEVEIHAEDVKPVSR